MRENLEDSGLEALFAEARARDARPPSDLLARVLADAEDVRPGRRRSGLFAALFRALGGWPSAAGLVAAGAAGVLIGYTAPGLIPLPGSTAAGYDLVDLAPGYPLLADLGG